LWAKEIRLLKVGQALLKVVNDPNVYRVNVERHAPGYLDWDIPQIVRYRPEGIEAVQELIEQNFASEMFVSPLVIERQTEARLQRLLNPPIMIPARNEENPLA
jgi:hypothetical protein